MTDNGGTTALAKASSRAPVRKALKQLDGRATAADVVAQTGLDLAEVEATLKSLLEVHEGHLEVSDSGDLVYRFQPDLITRDHVPLTTRVGRALYGAFKEGFKAWTMVMLVAYFVVFVALMVGAVVASQGRGGGGRRGNPLRALDWFWAPRWRLGRGYYGRKHEARRNERIPFYKKVFAFIFGPDDAAPALEERDRERAQLIRAKGGALTSTELIEYTGLPQAEAEEEMARLMGAFEGEPVVSDDGEIVYLFPELMVSAHGPVDEVPPPVAWRRLEKPLELTGNPRRTDLFIAGLNAFNLLAALAAPTVLLPALGMGGTAAMAGLFWVPLTFSSLFFGIPWVRSFALKRKNQKRWRANVRRALIPIIFKSAVEHRKSITVEDALDWVRSAIRERETSAEVVEEEFNKLAAEFDADVEADADGRLHFDFRKVREAYLAGRAIRDAASLDQKRLGPTVYDTEDTAAQANERDLKAFDRALKRQIGPGGDARPGGVRYLEDFDLRDFDRALKPAPGRDRTLPGRGTGRRPR